MTRRAPCRAGALLLLAACASSATAPSPPVSDPPLGPVPSDRPRAGLEVSSRSAGPGSRIALAAVVEQAGVTITAAQGIVRFDPARLRLVGLAPEAPVPVVGLGGIAAGELRWVNVRVGGLPRRAAVFVFEVRSAGWTSGLTLELQEANDPQGEPLPAASIFPLREPGDLVVPANPVSPP